MSSSQSSPCRRVIVLDSSAFIAGFDPFSLSEEQVTVPKVEEEIRRNSIVKIRFEMAIESGKLKVKAPTQESQVKAEAFGNKMGDTSNLSETDKQLLALAFEMKATGYTPQLVTDDYSIQNVGTKMGIDFLSLATLGIKQLLEWIRYCPACYKQYAANSKFNECQVCGTKLKRKPKRQTKWQKSR